ncbi:phosphonate metabolism protein/1,5-bisphosphokinase (PRPP-forming) PhnN [Ferrovibrio terrae]|uniref:Ribose 1,5-bisphosphate phosphokinase PhnN n=2 Tax=Ferrovibrio terrae TaxID=2594003 RepID=A0A516H7F5_9PROT|nr:phosphonate metabolism protein/1,5-bisphosphokinase (PRPP-forming) PhnN [Ferrovibrio terrae]
MPKGRLVLVTGPSGVGKDSLLDGARVALAGRSDIVFPRRVITRAAGLGGEEYQAVSEAEFAAMVARGAFALFWTAHGLHYGIPASIESDLAAGRQVVVNVSRGVIEEARAKYPGLLVLAINASPDMLRRRLQARGRESAVEIEERLQRAAAFRLDGDDVAALNNDGPLAEGVAALSLLLQKRG